MAFAAVTLFMLHIGNDLMVRVFWEPGSIRIYAPMIAAMIGALIFCTVRYQEFSGLLRACTRASAVGLVVLMLIESPDYSLASPDAALPAPDHVRLPGERRRDGEALQRRR